MHIVVVRDRHGRFQESVLFSNLKLKRTTIFQQQHLGLARLGFNTLITQVISSSILFNCAFQTFFPIRQSQWLLIARMHLWDPQVFFFFSSTSLNMPILSFSYDQKKKKFYPSLYQMSHNSFLFLFFPLYVWYLPNTMDANKYPVSSSTSMNFLMYINSDDISKFIEISN